MTHILQIETSSKNCSVSIGTDGKLNCLCEEISPDFKHSENLHTFILWALEGAELELKEIHAVAIGMGPGSYTGLRIGLASAKGLCFGNDIPLIALNSLHFLAYPYFRQEYEFIIPIMDARRMEIYTTIFNSEGDMIEKTHPHILNKHSFENYRNKKILFIGDATAKTENFFQDHNLNFEQASFILSYPSAKNMSQLSYEKYQQKGFENVAYFDPLYLKEWGK